MELIDVCGGEVFITGQVSCSHSPSCLYTPLLLCAPQLARFVRPPVDSEAVLLYCRSTKGQWCAFWTLGEVNGRCLGQRRGAYAIAVPMRSLESPDLQTWACPLQNSCVLGTAQTRVSAIQLPNWIAMAVSLQCCFNRFGIWGSYVSTTCSSPTTAVQHCALPIYAQALSTAAN